MTNLQLLTFIISVAGLNIGLAVFLKYYIDAKIDAINSKFEAKFETINAKLDHIAGQTDLLIHYMMEHHGKIASLEEKTKNL